MKKLVISLDGPSGSGKGTIALMLAKEFNLTYFQSSLLYRGLAYLCMQHNIAAEDHSNVVRLAQESDILQETNRVDLNTEEIGNFTSKISVISEVRDALSANLRCIIGEHQRIIMEGRDIGSVVAPNADLKLFITASAEVRARRRYKQLCSEGKSCMLEDIFRLIKERDARDASRKDSPLVVPNGAVVIDSSNLEPDEVINKIKNSIATHDNAHELLKLFNLEAEA